MIFKEQHQGEEPVVIVMGQQQWVVLLIRVAMETSIMEVQPVSFPDK